MALKQTHLLRGAAGGVALLTAATFGAVALNTSATRESRDAGADRIASLAASRAVSDSSAGLTNTVRHYAVALDQESLDAYWTEVLETRRRPRPRLT